MTSRAKLLRMMRRVFILLVLCLPLFATEPDAQTRTRWAYVTALANDGMEIRIVEALRTMMLRARLWIPAAVCRTPWLWRK